jgi:superfamily II DNA or RNA helicase
LPSSIESLCDVSSCGDRVPQSVFKTQHRAVRDGLDGAVACGLLWPHQAEAVRCLDAALQRDRVACAVLPTGAGKSAVAVLFLYCINASRARIVAPSKIVAGQLSKDYAATRGESFLVKRGLIQVDKEIAFLSPSGLILIMANLRQPLMVINAQKFGPTSSVPINEIPNDSYDMVILGEAHHYPVPTWLAVVNHSLAASTIVFLTATP